MDFDGHVMASDEAVTSKRLKLRRSCESCRGSKGRCIPSPDDSHRCLRCVKEGKPCVFLEAKPRPKRAKNSRVRVAEMEEKLEGLLALVAANAANQSGVNEAPAPAPASATQPPPVSHGLSTMSMPDTIITDFTYDTPSSSSHQSEQSIPQQHPVFVYPIFDNLQDAISKGFISLSQAEDALRVYRSKQKAFPFVVLPPNISLDSLRRQRPFLFLAVICCATEHNYKLQQHIELELRENLSRRILVNGEKSLDLLQGILVYLTWYHFYFHPDREQIYQLSQMAVSMTVDLGMDKPIRQAQTGFVASDVLPFLSHSRPSPGEIEAMRAYLGCYFLTSSICQGLRKPSNMKHTQRVKTCTQTIADAAVAESDHLIPYLIRIRQVSEEVNQAFNYDSNAHLPQLDSVRTEILGRAFEQQLDHIEASFPPEVWDNIQIKLSFYNLRIYVNEVGFHATAPPEPDLLSSLSAPLWYHSIARNDCLMRCLKATKTYLDQFLALPDSVISSMVTFDLLQLVYAVLILGSFSSGFDAPTIDQEQVRQLANMDYYLNAVSARFARLVSIQDPAANSYKHHMNTLFQTSKQWYIQMVTDPTPSGSPRFIFKDIIGTITGRCADFSTVCEMSEAASEDQWTEMLSEWAASSLDPSLIATDSTLIQFQA
ncbi:hypothetical protein DL95DRAFT_460915 [Leptodontidium sp. 2 PMI_412]|nr:hypothetical protein BKA61DRAFT_354563 [Leptodontidium sp. MPI-SDFR-AT-0119]KAH9215784.1 hypothetical protein DL95DRAFT_460915 [Leptodontidium sp. 2 PMI_412]